MFMKEIFCTSTEVSFRCVKTRFDDHLNKGLGNGLVMTRQSLWY